MLQVLSFFPTDELLRLVPICQRFQDLILRILHSRLVLAASLEDLKLLLECYHPSAQFTEPYLLCESLGTPSLTDSIESQYPTHDAALTVGRLGRLSEIYSRFRPTRQDAGPPLRSHPAGDIPGSRTFLQDFTYEPSDVPEVVRQTINLDAHELFSQLCVSTNLAKLGPRRGVFLSCTDVLKTTTPRIWRQWLAEQSTNIAELSDDLEGERIIWVDNRKNVGIRTRVRERSWRRDSPVLIHSRSMPSMSFNRVRLTPKFTLKKTKIKQSVTFSSSKVGHSVTHEPG